MFRPSAQANSIRFLRLDPETAKKIEKTSQRFWLSGIAFSILSGLATTGRLCREIKSLKKGATPGEKVEDEVEHKVQIRTARV